MLQAIQLRVNSKNEKEKKNNNRSEPWRREETSHGLLSFRISILQGEKK